MLFLKLWFSPLTVSCSLYLELIDHNIWIGALARVLFDDSEVITMGRQVEKLSSGENLIKDS